MLQTPLSQASTALVAAGCLWAAGRGAWPERIGAAAIALDWLGGVVFTDMHWYHHAQPAIFGLDTALFGVLLALVLCSRRSWVLWAAACALLLLLTHMLMQMASMVGQWSFLTALYIWNLGVVTALVGGAAVEGRRPAALTGFATPNARARRRS